MPTERDGPDYGSPHLTWETAFCDAHDTVMKAEFAHQGYEPFAVTVHPQQEPVMWWRRRVQAQR